jgi:hypothetical protein
MHCARNETIPTVISGAGLDLAGRTFSNGSIYEPISQCEQHFSLLPTFCPKLQFAFAQDVRIVHVVCHCGVDVFGEELIEF